MCPPAKPQPHLKVIVRPSLLLLIVVPVARNLWQEAPSVFSRRKVLYLALGSLSDADFDFPAKQ